MNRLQAELHRLYLPHDAQRQTPGSEERGLIGPDGRVRAMMLELARPASWAGVAKVWQGIQVDLELPAPAIVVSGVDGYQLWFSLSEPVPVAQAVAFLESLRRRYLGDMALERIAMKPSVSASAPGHARHVEMVPPAPVASDCWSAFVAPDLAALFADEPWLDLPPGSDAQADLLTRIESAKPGDWKRALERLGPAPAPGAARTATALMDVAGGGADLSGERWVAAADSPDPKCFLLAVMNDPAIELHLRIEAAKALLPYFEGSFVSLP